MGTYHYMIQHAEHEYATDFNPEPTQRDPCVLVGDVTGAGKPQLIVLTFSRTYDDPPPGIAGLGAYWRVFPPLDKEGTSMKTDTMIYKKAFTSIQNEMMRFCGLASQDDGQRFLDMFYISGFHDSSGQ